MRRTTVKMLAGVAAVAVMLMGSARASQAQVRPGHQDHQMPSHGMHHASSAAPTLPGQDAFGAIQEIVRILEGDPATDWSKVDLERLRRHLIDMNEVTLRAGVKAEPVSGGLRMDITGIGRTEQAIRAMVVPHTSELNQMKEWSARAETIPDGVRLTVVARDPADGRTVARIRGLGFIGLLVQGGHHQPHHLAMARGEAIRGHGH